MKKIIISLFLILGLSESSFSQIFTFKYNLDTAKEEGWYKLVLGPEIRANASSELTDLRLYDSKDSMQELPYYLAEEKDSEEEVFFSSFKWEKTQKQNTDEYLVRTELNEIGQLVLKISNHKDARHYKIEGSSDGKNWFSLVENDWLEPENSTTNTYYWTTLNFPKSAYSQLKLNFLDSNLSPIQVLDIGKYQTSKQESLWLPINEISYLVEDLPNEKKTLVKIYSSKKIWLNQFSLRVSAPAFYDRSAVFYEKTKEKNRKGKWIESINSISNFEIRTASKNSFPLNYYLEDTLYLEIENGDNAALKFEDFSFFQRPKYLITYFQKGQVTALFVGNSLLKKPNYDLESFTNASFTKRAPYPLEIICYEALEKPDEQIEETPFLESKGIMWLGIGVGVLAVFYFSAKLLKEKES
ncbi:MAG: hypothetical protein K9I36_08725 [Bacteroidia bacterium]|nr:hypothetical protein [Bacteroidia bacterium]MCF8426801.1 hypothetical protein [Bacteroidia bacterium]